MSDYFNDKQPIYRQLKDRAIAMILDGELKPGEPLPSVRAVAAEMRLNPLTVSKAYQMLADEGLVETRRGLGMFVLPGARETLLHDEKAQFLEQEWPSIRAKIERLGLSTNELLDS